MRFERLAFDTNAAVDFLRLGRPQPTIDGDVETLVLPLFVLAELELGVSRSSRREENARRLKAFVADCQLLAPDASSIPYYVRVRNMLESGRVVPRSPEKLEGLHHDLWIVALCLQHRLPLLSNDRDFDGIEGLEVLHW